MPVLSLACHLPHNAPHIPWRYNYEQTTKQTKAINNSYIYINISCKCDTNRAGHLTLDAYASRPVACVFIGYNQQWPPGDMPHTTAGSLYNTVPLNTVWQRRLWVRLWTHKLIHLIFSSPPHHILHSWASCIWRLLWIYGGKLAALMAPL